MSKIAFIGVGVMGRHMIRNLINNGHDVIMYTRNRIKAEDLSKETGAKLAGSIKEAVSDVDFVISIVGYPKDVEEVYFGDRGIIVNADKNSILIDMTTSSPSLALRIYQEAKKRGIAALDAPVSGGDKGAKLATLSIMVGGDREAFEKAEDIFKAMGKNIYLMGGPSFGQHTKACNQIAVAGATAAYTEAMVYAKNVGLDMEKMFTAISSGAAGSWQIDNMAPRAMKEDFDPGFFIKHFIKDMKIISSEMENKGVELPMLNSVLKMYEEMAEKGLEDYGTQSLIKRFEK